MIHFPSQPCPHAADMKLLQWESAGCVYVRMYVHTYIYKCIYLYKGVVFGESACGDTQGALLYCGYWYSMHTYVHRP